MKVLVVEDERKIADLVRKALETSGFIVETCTNGDDALAWASRSAFDASTSSHDFLSSIRRWFFMLDEYRMTSCAIDSTNRWHMSRWVGV